MKKINKFILIGITLLLIVGCSSKPKGIEAEFLENYTAAMNSLKDSSRVNMTITRGDEAFEVIYDNMDAKWTLDYTINGVFYDGEGQMVYSMDYKDRILKMDGTEGEYEANILFMDDLYQYVPELRELITEFNLANDKNYNNLSKSVDENGNTVYKLSLIGGEAISTVSWMSPVNIKEGVSGISSVEQEVTIDSNGKIKFIKQLIEFDEYGDGEDLQLYPSTFEFE